MSDNQKPEWITQAEELKRKSEAELEYIQGSVRGELKRLDKRIAELNKRRAGLSILDLNIAFEFGYRKANKERGAK